MEDRRGEDGVRPTLADRPDEVGRTGRAARGDHRHPDPARDRSEELGVEARAGPVAVDRGDQQLAGPQLDGPLGPGDGIEPGRSRPPWTTRPSPGRPADRRSRAASIATTTAWRPKRAAHVDQGRVGDCRAVERDLVGAGAQDVAHLADAPHAAADGQRDERPPGGPLDELEEGSPALGRGGDVEIHDLVGALGRVPGGELDRVALVDEVHEAGALDHPPVGDVEAGDHPPAEHQAIARRCAAARPRRSREVGEEAQAVDADCARGGTGPRAGCPGRSRRGTGCRARSGDRRIRYSGAAT